MTQKREGSRSEAQKSAEVAAVKLFGAQQGVDLAPAIMKLRDRRFDVDGYCKTDDRVVLAEVWAHIGPAKSAQRNKVLADVLKLALISKILREEQPSRTVESYIVFTDQEAAQVIKNESWGALAAAEFGITSAIVELPPALTQQVRDAQILQDLRNPE